VRWAEPERLLLLWILPLVLGILIWAARRRRKLESELGDSDVLRSLTGDPGRGARLLRGGLLVAALALAAIGTRASAERIPPRHDDERRRGRRLRARPLP
jgi:hypothetical protein